MSQNINFILKEVLNKINPKKDEIKKIDFLLRSFISKIKDNIRKNGIYADVFVGGSWAKRTIIKKDRYDIDIFIRFNKDYKSQYISTLTEKILSGIGMNKQKIHGSRDYFIVKVSKEVFFEIIPVKKISNPKEAENITDLSYLHVKYINKKIKSERMRNDIRLIKAFCFANNCYGAESYISGFSGYGLELLVYYYGSFLKLIKEIAKVSNNKKLIIDIEKHYKNKERILLDINSAKLQSPIILIDPTYKQRNVLAALSNETFKKFQNAIKRFLKNHSVKAFEQKEIDVKKIENIAKSKNYEFLLIKALTDRQEGDVAASKLLKFYKYILNDIEKFFEVNNKGFKYQKGKSALFFFVTSGPKEILIKGPLLNQREHVNRFKQKYRKLFIKNDRIYAKYKTSSSLHQFIKRWKQKYKKQIKDMSIKKLDIIK
ncbi:MAG: hypothetical protein QXX55_00975 [Candidatus Pacearchaeota archaeon]